MCISSIQKLNKNSIEFSLSTWIRSRIKLSSLSPYMFVILFIGTYVIVVVTHDNLHYSMLGN